MYKNKYVKGALCRFGEVIQTPNFNIYNINKIIIQMLNIYVPLVNKQAVLRRKSAPLNIV